MSTPETEVAQTVAPPTTDEPTSATPDVSMTMPAKDEPSSAAKDEPSSAAKDEPPSAAEDEPPSAAKDEPPSASPDATKTTAEVKPTPTEGGLFSRLFCCISANDVVGEAQQTDATQTKVVKVATNDEIDEASEAPDPVAAAPKEGTADAKDVEPASVAAAASPEEPKKVEEEVPAAPSVEVEA